MTPDIYGARKQFHDWLDKNRPWARPEWGVYQAMELMVDAAAWAFRNDHRPTKEEMGDLQQALMRFTEPLSKHPEDYDGPCLCAECRSCG